MKAEYNNATIKCWFNNLGICRNFQNVTEIVMSENSYLIIMADGKQAILSQSNVNMLEEIKTEENITDKKIQELKDEFKR